MNRTLKRLYHRSRMLEAQKQYDKAQAGGYATAFFGRTNAGRRRAERMMRHHEAVFRKHARALHELNYEFVVRVERDGRKAEEHVFGTRAEAERFMREHEARKRDLREVYPARP